MTRLRDFERLPVPSYYSTVDTKAPAWPQRPIIPVWGLGFRGIYKALGIMHQWPERFAGGS